MQQLERTPRSRLAGGLGMLAAKRLDVGSGGDRNLTHKGVGARALHSRCSHRSERQPLRQGPSELHVFSAGTARPEPAVQEGSNLVTRLAILLLASLAVSAGPSYAMKNVEKVLEQELRLWFASELGATTSKPLGLQTADPLGQYEGAPVDNDIDESGQLSFSVMGFVVRYPLAFEEILVSLPSGSRLKGVDVRLRRTAVEFKFGLGELASTDVHVRKGGEWRETTAKTVDKNGVGYWAQVRLVLGKGYAKRYDAEALLDLLSNVLDLGAEYRDLRAANNRFLELEKEIEDAGLEGVRSDGSDASAIESYERARALGRLLEEALANRQSVAEMFGRSPETRWLKEELTELDSLLPTLKTRHDRAVLGHLGLQHSALKSQIAAAERNFRQEGLEPEERLRRALVLVGLVAAGRGNRVEAANSKSEQAKPVQIYDSILRDLQDWIDASREASMRGCFRGDPLSAELLQRLAQVETPDHTIGIEIGRCGISFEPNVEIIRRLEEAGVGQMAQAAILAQATSRWNAHGTIEVASRLPD